MQTDERDKMSQKDNGPQRSHGSRRHVLRSLALHLAACAVVVGALAWVIDTHVEPLAAPPEAPPPGLHLSWAGQPIRGYVENENVHLFSCSKPASITLELYPPGDQPRTASPAARVAFAVSGEWAGRMSRDPMIKIEQGLEGQFVPLEGKVKETIDRSHSRV
jgi:hypothetical protein